MSYTAGLTEKTFSAVQRFFINSPGWETLTVQHDLLTCGFADNLPLLMFVDPIMLWVDREGGHGQGKPMRIRVRDLADRWSFTMWQTGMPTIAF